MFDVNKYHDDDEDDGWGDTSRDKSGDDCNNTNTKNCTGSENNKNNDASATAHTTQAPSSNTAVPAFPLLQRFGLDDIDLSEEWDNNRFKRLLGELIAKQQQHSGRRNAIEYIQPSQNVSTTAIAVRSHKSHKAFKTYHRMNPYLGDVVATLDDDKRVGAQRLSDYLAKEHPKQFIEAAKSSGVAVCGVLDKTESAALFTDAGLKDEQWNTIMRHLRHKFDSKIAVSLKQVKGKCRDGGDIQEQIRKTKRPRGSYKKDTPTTPAPAPASPEVPVTATASINQNSSDSAPANQPLNLWSNHVGDGHVGIDYL